MFRPMFSASHSAQLERRHNNGDHPALMRWNHQVGVPRVFGDIWASYTDIPKDESAWGTPQESDDEDTTTTTRESDEQLEHRDERERLQETRQEQPDSHGRTISAQQIDETSVLPIPLHPRIMANKTRLWVSLWFLITVPIIFWDAGYCFLRPRSMKGGDLHWIWSPYALYQDVDYVYGLRAYENGEGFTNAQSFLNIVENFMNIGYLYLAHVNDSPLAPLLGFASVIMTLSKTVLYWLQEYYCGGCSVGHNDSWTLFVYWIVPNGLWLVVPSFIIYVFASDIAAALKAVNSANKKTASGKTQ